MTTYNQNESQKESRHPDQNQRSSVLDSDAVGSNDPNENVADAPTNQLQQDKSPAPFRKNNPGNDIEKIVVVSDSEEEEEEEEEEMEIGQGIDIEMARSIKAKKVCNIFPDQIESPEVSKHTIMVDLNDVDISHVTHPVQSEAEIDRRRRRARKSSIFNFNRSSMFTFSQSSEFYEFLETAKMKVEKTEAYFFNNGMTVALGGLFFALNIIVGSHAAYQYTEQGGFTTDNDILWITLPIARVGGRLVTFNCAWLLLTACKYLWTLVRTHVVPIVPIGFPIDDIMPKYHRFVALWIIVCGCIIHTLPQIVNFATGALSIDDGSKVWTFGNGMGTRQLLITGIMLTMIFIMFFLTTLKAFRKTAAGFRWFWWFHMGGIALAYPLLIVHGTKNGRPIFLYAALGPLVLYLIDIAMRRLMVTKAKILEWKTHNGAGQKIVELILECPPNFEYKPGQYMDLNFKPISKTEWHPFTIASSPSNDVRSYDGKQVNVLIFFIQAQGRWTEALFNYASAFDLSKATTAMEVSMRGPHGAPAMNFFEYKHIIVVGSGVGVTPLLSVWQYMVDQGDTDVQQNGSLMGGLAKFLSKRSHNHWDINDSLIGSSQQGAKKSKGLLIGPSLHGTSTVPTLPVSENAELSYIENETTSNFRLVMESLTLSIFLYGFFLIGETIIVVLQIWGHYMEVASLEIIFASTSLIIHAGTIIATMFAKNGGWKMCLLFKYWIEFMITLVDTLNLFLAIVFLRNNRDEAFAGMSEMELQTENLLSDGLNRHLESQQQFSTRWIIGLGAVTVFLHAIRIFHIFYTTLKPNTERQEQPQSKVSSSSIQGIFINKHYTGMRFCFEQLLKPLEDGMSKAFSLNFYGTRETTNNVGRSSLSMVTGFPEGASYLESLASASQSDYYCFHKGRPDWHKIFRKALRNAHEANPQGGDSVGVFFCGSPAIAKCLRSMADKVNAQHQFATKMKWGKASKCKIVIHVENF